jgi:DNA-binding NtrC family response regulator
MMENSPRRALVVDDESLIRWSLAETLGDHGYAVVEAENARAARAAVNGGAGFDVVLLDFMLPDSNDLGLLTDIRRLAPNACVILMTAYETPEMVWKAKDLGALRVVNKPFEVADILALVDSALGPHPS